MLNNLFGVRMPFIVFGVIILIIACIIIPLIGLLFSNPIGFAVGLILIGLLYLIGKWLIVVLGIAVIKTTIKTTEALSASSRWQSLIKAIKSIDPLESDKPSYYFAATMLILGIIAVVYFNYYPVTY